MKRGVDTGAPGPSVVGENENANTNAKQHGLKAAGAEAGAEKRSDENAPVVVVTSGSRGLLVVCMILSGLLTVAVAMVVYLLREWSEREQTVDETLTRFERKMQGLEAGISYDSRRQKLLLGMRDEIMAANPKIALRDAYDYADYALRASEKYPSIPPLLLVSVGIVESRYRPDSVSSADAKGLYQIWPSTGRLLARSLGWEYREEMLFDPVRNTEMAAFYLDVLFAAYNDPSLVLAEYNGGPINAGRLRARADDVSPETKDYVEKVLRLRARLEKELEYGRSVQVESIHRDRRRAGKRLGVPAVNAAGQRFSPAARGVEDKVDVAEE